MDATAITNLALMALQAVLNVIAEIRSTSGLTDDAILAQAQALDGANDTLYSTLQAALKGSTPPAA